MSNRVRADLAVALTLTLVFAGAGGVRAAVLDVPADYPTIQDAVDAAADGDEVHVAPGTYFETVVVVGKSVALIAPGGPDVTTLDGTGLGSIVMLQQAGASSIEGFTITGATMDPVGAPAGGAIIAMGGSPTIRGNRIEWNIGASVGGGIYMTEATGLIEANEIRNNNAYCPFAIATPCGSGGGISVFGGSVTIRDNWIESNNAALDGGGVTLSSTSAWIENNVVIGNAATSGAGFLIGFGCDVVFFGNLIVENIATGYPGLGVAVPGFGGGLSIVDGAIVEIRSTTIAANEALGSAGFGGISRSGGIDSSSAAVTIRDSIVSGNLADEEAQVSNTPLVDVSFSLVLGGYPGVAVLDDDPLFVAGPADDYYLSQIAAGQTFPSPAVDAGDPMSPLIPGTTRTDEVLDSGLLDLGYHRVPPGERFVRADANADGGVDVSDAIFVLASLFVGGSPAPSCLDAADVNDDGLSDVSDAVLLLASLFVAGTPPVPAPQTCGPDPTDDALDCASYPGC